MMKRLASLVAVSVTSTVLAAPALQGGGASFPAPIYKRWAQDFEAKTGSHVEYNSQGSGFGITGITENTLDFAGSDAPMNKAERAKAGGDEAVVHIPSVAGAVVITYNLPGFSGEVKLTGEVIADVYLGKISKWDDAKIAALNEGVKLPSTPITPVYRSDGSGTTFVFTNYLATQSQDFIKASPPGKTITVAAGQAGKGNEGVSNQVKKIPGALGYVELTYALNEHLPHAAVKNKAGKFAVASPDSVSAAGKGAEAKMKGAALAANIWNSDDADAYPISSFTYLLVRKDLGYLKDESKARAVAAFLKYAIEEGQSVASGLSYAPLPEGVKARGLEAVKALTFDGKPLQ